MNSAEAAILSRILKPEHDDLSPEAARSLLKLEFDPDDLSRMHELALRAQAGNLTDGEENELESYRRIGRLLEVIRSKARRSLARAGRAA
jgi:phosphate uptake regulator